MTSKNITFITTTDHNVGDDFVREGLKYLIKQKFPNHQFNFSHIHKHVPISSRNGFESIRDNRIGRRLEAILPLSLTKDKILSADLIIQSGAPFFWCHETGGSHCYQNEWYKPLIQNRYTLIKNKPLLNLAVGTCQAYHATEDSFCEKCLQYINDFYQLSSVTTLRDSFSNRVLSRLNLQAPVIPCSSLFAVDEYNIENQGEEYVVVNFMEGGAHYTFGQDIDFHKWEKTFTDFYFEIKQKEKIVFVCHNMNELKVAQEIDPHGEYFYEKNNYKAYMLFYSRAKIGIMNRVHGAYMMASLGKPSIIIGNDTRALMAKEINLKSYFVNDVTKEILLENYEELLENKEKYKSALLEIKKQAFMDYMQKAFNKIVL